MKLFIFNIVFLTSIFFSLDCLGFPAKVTRVVDGDSIIIIAEDSSVIKVRLTGIDTPELKQEFGTESKKALEDKVLNKMVYIDGDKKDRYGRLIANIKIGSRWINKELIEEGYAWHYKQYSKDQELTEAELHAKKLAIGLWTSDNPIPPWEYRKLKK